MMAHVGTLHPEDDVLGDVSGVISHPFQIPGDEQRIERLAGHFRALVHLTDEGDKRLVAYVVFHSNQSATVEQLRAALKARLPEYMAPSILVFLEALPQTPNGKIDRDGQVAHVEDTHAVDGR